MGSAIGKSDRPQNGFSSKTTAIEASEGADLSSQIMIVTGANTGIGKETAKTLAGRGAHVIMACRSLERGGAAAEEIEAYLAELGGERGSVEVALLDLASFASVLLFAAEYIASERPLHCLICNAGLQQCSA